MLSGALKRFVMDNSHASIDTKKATQRTVELFLKAFGDAPASIVGGAKAGAFRDLLFALPASLGKRKSSLTLEEEAQRAREEGLPTLSGKNRPRLERIKTHYDAEFAALANPKKREEWLNRQFEAQSRARQRLIYDWNEKHRPAKEQARRDMSLFRSLLDSKPFSAERAEFTKLASQMPLENDLLQALQKPIMKTGPARKDRACITA